MRIEVNVSGHVGFFKNELIKEIVKDVVRKLREEGSFLIDVDIVSPSVIRKLNRNFRKKDKTTDVLSFETKDTEIVLPKGIKYLGNIILCPDFIERKSKEIGITPKREFAQALVHGLLHTLGYDHKNKKEEDKMNKKEVLLQRTIKW